MKSLLPIASKKVILRGVKYPPGHCVTVISVKGEGHSRKLTFLVLVYSK